MDGASICTPAPTAGAAARTAPSTLVLLAPLFATTIFASAALLFFVEPMFAKMVLPRLGGSPAVWNTCVVFFQAAMLAGYGYAHLISRRLRLWQQVVLHISLLFLVALNLPVAIPEDWVPPVDRTPVPALLGLLLFTVGGPFLAVSATAPLLQRWISFTRHPSAADPYFLYAASNAGSLVALLGYPFLVEPRWGLPSQSHGWATGYLVLAILIVACAAGVLHWRSDMSLAAASTLESAGTQTVLTWRRRARWVALAFVPSSLMLAVTTFVSTDIAAVPLLWIAPLTLYLLSFVIAFVSRPIVPAWLSSNAMTVVLLPLTFTMMFGLSEPLQLVVPLHLVAFFVCAYVLHRALACDRPDTRHLTEFYLWLAVGGVLGGAFNTFIAPLIFTGVAEYPIALVLACALRPASRAASIPIRTADFALPLGLGASAVALQLTVKDGGPLTFIVLVMLGTLYAACSKRPLRLAAGLAAVFVLTGSIIQQRANGVLYAERTFFGVLRVRVTENNGGRYQLMHGNTVHGEQSVNPALRQAPVSYYYEDGPVGQLFSALSHRFTHVGVMGLGTGALAVYATPDQHWTFYEIDPAVERIARASQFFTYLDDCGDQCKVVLGDGRLSMAAVAPGRYDAIILDAFSSDAIPLHLLTRQALELYLAKLSDRGVLVFHISNRHLGLRPVVGALARDLDLTARAQLHRPRDQSIGRPSEWVVVARSEEHLGALAADSRWQRLGGDARYVWTDDYSDILSVLARR